MAIKLEEIKSVRDRVTEVLFSNKQANTSDDLLYLLVCEGYGREMGMRVEDMTMGRFMTCCRALGFPGYETVRRARQKVQEQYPALRGNSHGREESEASFRAFALNKDGKS